MVCLISLGTSSSLSTNSFAEQHMGFTCIMAMLVCIRSILNFRQFVFMLAKAVTGNNEIQGIIDLK